MDMREIRYDLAYSDGLDAWRWVVTWPSDSLWKRLMCIRERKSGVSRTKKDAQASLRIAVSELTGVTIL